MQPIRFKLPVIIFIIFTLCLVLIQPATAADRGMIFYVRQGFSGNCLDWATACDLQTALGLAGDGDQVRVAAGNYYPTSTTNRGISFQMETGVAIYGGFPAAGGAWETRNWLTHVTTLSANIGDPTLVTDNSYHVVKNISVGKTAILNGFVLTGGYADYDNDFDWHGAGMLNLQASSPTLINLLITGNEVTIGSGGGMYNFESSPSLDKVTINANHANSGGGMYSDTCTGTLSVSNSTFSGNQAHYQGGGMQNEGCTVTLSNVIFSGNDAFDSSGDGGGMANFYSSNVTLSHVTFTENTAVDCGGAMYNNNSTINVSTSAFTDNGAEQGGGVYNDSGTMSMSRSTLTGNDVTYDGGGMYVTGNTLTLSDVDFVSNTSLDSGGGFMGINSASTLNRINFENNSASDSGAGAYLEGGTPIFTDIKFTANSSSYTGGGLTNYGSSPTLTNVTFSENNAVNGGGLANWVGSHPKLRNVTFSANTADNGAAIYNFQSILEIYSATLTLNSASGLGGGIYSTKTSDVPCETTMINGIVWGNLPQANQVMNETGCYSVITYSDIEGGYPEFASNINRSPLLMPLADNGGFTLTHAVPYGSPVVDSGSLSSGFLPTDQRGFTRPFDGNSDGTATTDMGAYECEFIVGVFLPLILR